MRRRPQGDTWQDNHVLPQAAAECKYAACTILFDYNAEYMFGTQPQKGFGPKVQSHMVMRRLALPSCVFKCTVLSR